MGELQGQEARVRTATYCGRSRRNKKAPQLTRGVTTKSGGHGTRTRNPLRGTTFPVWPLTIRLPSSSIRLPSGSPSADVTDTPAECRDSVYSSLRRWKECEQVWRRRIA